MNCRLIIIVLIFSLFVFSCGKKEEPIEPKEEPKEGILKNYVKIDILKTQLAKFVPAKIDVDLSVLDENEKKALGLLVKAAKNMNKLFMMQVYEKNQGLETILDKGEVPEYGMLKDFFRINYGPFNRLNNDQPFINMEMKKPLGANFYPTDMTKEEFNKYIQANPQDKEAFISNVTLIRKKQDKLVAIPYTIAYKTLLTTSSQLLNQAAELIENPALKKYLNNSAKAFLDNNYKQSNTDWLELKDSKLDFVIGPHYLYEDKLFGYKSSFMSYVMLVDQEENKRIASFAGQMEELKKNLPIEDQYKNFQLPENARFTIANEVYSSGIAKAGPPHIAFILPNDEEARKAMGSKKVLLKNILKAKFENILVPIMKKVLAESQQDSISFDAYFNHIIMREMSMDLTPMTKDNISAKVQLKDLYPLVKMIKAEALGLYNMEQLVAKELVPGVKKIQLFSIQAGGLYACAEQVVTMPSRVRIIQFNYFKEKGGLTSDEAGKISIDETRMSEAVKQLTRDMLMIEATADYAAAKKMVDTYGSISPQMQQGYDAVSVLPKDITAVHTIGK